MDMKRFNQRMSKLSKKPHYFKGGAVMKDGVPHFLNGGAAATGALGGAATGAAVGSVVPGIGTAIGAVGGALVGGLAGLFSGSTNQQPNLTDPISGAQITDANGNVVANEANLQAYASTLQQMNGASNQSLAFNDLNNVANGVGPNPAQAQLNQSTAQNVADQSALMASVRGANANPGLIARQAAQQGAATQQQAAGQAATLEAAQRLNAINSEGAIAGQQVGETITAQQNAAAAGLSNQGAQLGALGGYNTSLTSAQGNINTNNTSQGNTTQTNLVPFAQGAFSGAGTSAVAGAQPSSASTLNMPHIGQSAGYARGGRIALGPHKSHVANYLFAGGGQVKAMVSAGERYLSPDDVKRVVEHGENPLKLGTKFNGKAKVKGDSLKNDTIPATLQEGGVVLPRHIMNKKNKDHAELFVRRAVHMKTPKGK